MKDSSASWCYKLHMLFHKHGLEMYLGAITLFLFLKVAGLLDFTSELFFIFNYAQAVQTIENNYNLKSFFEGPLISIIQLSPHP